MIKIKRNCKKIERSCSELMPFHSFSPGCYARYWSTEDTQQSLSMSVNIFVERFSLLKNGLVWQLMVVQIKEHQLDQSSQSSQRSQLNHLLTVSRQPSAPAMAPSEPPLEIPSSAPQATPQPPPVIPPPSAHCHPEAYPTLTRHWPFLRAFSLSRL